MLFLDVMLRLNAGLGGASLFLIQHNEPSIINSSWEGKWMRVGWGEAREGGGIGGGALVLECKTRFQKTYKRTVKF